MSSEIDLPSNCLGSELSQKDKTTNTSKQEAQEDEDVQMEVDASKISGLSQISLHSALDDEIMEEGKNSTKHKKDS